MNTDDPSSPPLINADDGGAAAAAANKQASKRARWQRCTAAVFAFTSIVCIVIGAVAAGVSDSERDYGYSVEQCRVVDVFSDGSCVYVLVNNDNRTLCAVPASVAMRSSFGASPACFAANADETTLSTFERRQNEEDARTWSAALNASVLCALPVATNDTRQLSECGEMALAEGLAAEAYRAWSHRLALAATDARLLRDALDAATRIERTAGWALIVFGLLLGCVALTLLVRSSRDDAASSSRSRYVPFHVRRARWLRAVRHQD